MLKSRLAVVLTAIAALAACATPQQGSRPVHKMAYITSGDTYFYGATRHGQYIAVIELDGSAVAAPADPIALQPGRHSFKMKCGENISTHTMSVLAGEIYQYAMRSAAGGKGCEAALIRVRGSF